MRERKITRGLKAATTLTKLPNSANVQYILCSNLVFHSTCGDNYSEYNIGMGNVKKSKLRIQKTYQV